MDVEITLKIMAKNFCEPSHLLKTKTTLVEHVRAMVAEYGLNCIADTFDRDSVLIDQAIFIEGINECKVFARDA